MTPQSAPTSSLSTMTPPSIVDRALRLFAPVRSGEGVVALLMFLCVFAILCAYYVLKTAREGLILSGGMFGLGGDELKIYATGVMAMLLVMIVPAYGALASRVRRIKLINISYTIVLSCLLAFFVLARAGVPIGLVFFIWLGLVNMFLVAQFWSYANDLYTEEQGKRLFAIIAIGGAAGAIFGPKVAKLAQTYTLLVVAAGLLAFCLALFNLIERIQVTKSASAAKSASEQISGDGGFALVLRDKYLLLIAGMALVSNLVNSTGEYLLSNVVTERAAQIATTAAERREWIKAFYADFFFWVNLVGFLVQAFLVSRLIARFGLRAAVFVLPLIALATYGSIASAAGIGALALVRVAKIAENATDYSVQNTVRQALFLPTERAVKYKAKAAIDTFFVRLGDTISAILIGIGIHQLDLDPKEIAVVNLGLVLVWIAIAVGIAKRYAGMTEATDVDDDAFDAATTLQWKPSTSPVGA